MEMKTRKPLRSPYIDYKHMGVYFITIGTEPRKNYFWQNPNVKYATPDAVELNEQGKIAAEVILQIPEHYSYVSVDSFVIMPDHIHMLLRFCMGEEANDASHRKSISVVINQMKGQITKRIGRSIWKHSFYDHVIRNDNDYEETMKYIYLNPMRWYYKYVHGKNK